MPPILVPSFVKRVPTQFLVISKLSGREDSILSGFVYVIVRPRK